MAHIDMNRIFENPAAKRFFESISNNTPAQNGDNSTPNITINARTVVLGDNKNGHTKPWVLCLTSGLVGAVLVAAATIVGTGTKPMVLDRSWGGD